MILFPGNDIFAYRDPCAVFADGACHLFFTLSEKDGGYMYNRLAYSRSTDLMHWSVPRCLTVRNRNLNFSSPGSVVRQGEDYVLCFCSYPLPTPYRASPYATDAARLYTLRTRDFLTFSDPVLLNPKGEGAPGRMIDPFLLEADGMYHLFFKQNGISRAVSRDLCHWDFLGRADGGENACVLPFRDRYLLIHSPENGLAFATSHDLATWEPYAFTTLNQSSWDWAAGRLTAGFAVPMPEGARHRYVLFFHGSRAVSPETHGNATLAAVFTDDFLAFSEEA